MFPIIFTLPASSVNELLWSGADMPDIDTDAPIVRISIMSELGNISGKVMVLPLMVYAVPGCCTVPFIDTIAALVLVAYISVNEVCIPSAVTVSVVICWFNPAHVVLFQYSIVPISVLYLTYPIVGLDGLTAVLPNGIPMADDPITWNTPVLDGTIEMLPEVIDVIVPLLNDRLPMFTVL